MGLFKKSVEKALKGDEFWLLDNGTEGTAVILDAEATRQTTTDSDDGQRVFKMRLRVTLPGQEPYEVQHKQWTFDHAPPGGDEVVRVRVDPDDREHLTIELAQPAPRSARERSERRRGPRDGHVDEGDHPAAW